MNFSLKKGEEFVNTYYDNKISVSKKQELIMEIFEIIYMNLESFGVYFKDEDLRSDFLLKFYYKIPRVLDTYNHNLASFYTYLTNSIRFSALTFRCKNVRDEINREIIAKEEDFRWHNILHEHDSNDDFNLYAAEAEPDYCKNMERKFISSKTKISKEELEFRRALYFNMPSKHRKIFLLACKACLFLDDDLIDKISAEIKMEPSLLCSILQDLRTACFKRLEKINYYGCNRNKYYIKVQLFRYLLYKTNNTQDQYETIKRSLDYNHNLMTKTLKLNKRQIKAPSSTDIQKYINICKGTIDKNIAKTMKIWYTPKNENISGIRKHK